MKNIIATFTLVFISFFALGQTNPVKFEITQNGDVLVFEAEIEEGWHLYAANLPSPDAGPLPTEFVFDAQTIDENADGVPDNSVVANGKITESEGIREMDDAFGVEVVYYKEHATFNVPYKVTIASPNSVAKGMIYYMVCNDESCIPFDVSFEVKLK